MGLRLGLVFILFINLNLGGKTLDKVRVSINNHFLDVEVANTPVKRSKGLMWRRHLAKNSGMLFVFDKAAPYKFWMKNTLIPLSIAFFDKQKKIIMLADMYVKSLYPIGPNQDALYALEVNQGWFVKKGIILGDKMVIIKKNIKKTHKKHKKAKK